MGVAICTWGGGGRGPAQAHCEIASDGSVVMRIGTQDLGTGTRTLVAIVAADTLGLQASQIKPEIGDTHVRRQPAVGRQHDRREHQPGDSHRGGQGARRAEGEGRAGARRRRRRRSSRPAAAFTSRTHPSQGPVVGRGVQAHRPAADRRRRRLAAGPVVGDHQRRAVRRGHRRRRDRHRQGDAGARAPGLRPRRQPAHGREPGLRRRHRLAELRDVRGPHPRPQHRADGQSEHGVVPARGHVGHSARSTCG